jgi:hypothetical protein
MALDGYLLDNTYWKLHLLSLWYVNNCRFTSLTLSREWMTTDRVWIGNQIYWTLTDRNYNYSAIIKSHSLQFTTACTKFSQSPAFTALLCNVFQHCRSLSFCVPRLRFSLACAYLTINYSESKLCYNQRSVGQSVFVSSPMWGPKSDFSTVSSGIVDVRRPL